MPISMPATSGDTSARRASAFDAARGSSSHNATIPNAVTSHSSVVLPNCATPIAPVKPIAVAATVEPTRSAMARSPNSRHAMRMPKYAAMPVGNASHAVIVCGSTPAATSA